ncbi:MAG: pectinesterase family protein [Chitinispirillia bacterium]|jgi:pectinesterase
MSFFKNGFLTGISVVMFSLQGWATERADIIVAKDGSGDFTTIQAAINSVSPSNSKNVTILIKNGTYIEHLGVNKSFISLIGENKEKTIIQFSIEREEWNKKNGSNVGCAVINIGCTPVYKKASGTVTNIVIGNLTVKNTYNDAGVKTMAIKDEGNSNKVYVVNCIVWSKGHDTISLWTKKTGMYYHANCDFTGSVDFVCPRGWCYAVACNFYQTSKGAPLWHEVASGTTQKFTIRSGRFMQAAGNSSNFKLLNQNNSSNLGTRYYLLDCMVSAKCDTKGKATEAYFHNCHGEANDQTWYASNLSSSPAKKQEVVTSKWTFDNKWDPENEMPSVLPMTSLPQPWSGAYNISANIQLKWVNGRNANKHAVYFGSSKNPPFVKTQTENTYTPSNPANGTYYWRVDAISGNDTVKGTVWSFTVGGAVPILKQPINTGTETPASSAIQESNGFLKITWVPQKFSPISIRIFNFQGRGVAVLPISSMSSSIHTVTYNPADYSISAGHYVIRFYSKAAPATTSIVIR